MHLRTLMLMRLRIRMQMYLRTRQMHRGSRMRSRMLLLHAD